MGIGASSLSFDMPPRSGLRTLVWRLSNSNSRMLLAFVCAANAVRLSAKLAVLRRRQRHSIALLRKSGFDLVCKTWSFGAQRPAGENDFYYGDLQQHLSRRGIRALFLCGDSSNGNWNDFSAAQFSTRAPCRMLSPFIPLRVFCLQVESSRVR